MQKSIVQRLVQITKSKALIAWVLLSLCGFRTYAQDEGFFSIYENPEHDYIPTCIVETNEGCLIVAAFDDSHSPSILYKMSERGEILGRAILDIDGQNACVVLNRIYQDALFPKQYCAIGSIHYLSEEICKPLVLHFDENLHLNEVYVVELPGDYRQFIMGRAILASDGAFLFATSLGQQNGFHRLYMKIEKDGTLLNFHEATDDCSEAMMINAIFEFPEGDYYGDYRISSRGLGYSMRLFGFGFGEDFVYDTIKEFQEIGNTTYSVSPITLANGSALVLDENSLLFADRAGEFYGPGSQHDNSTLLTMTDLEGNMSKYLVIGSMNDTADYPITNNAIDFTKTNDDETQNKRIYSGCFGTSNGWFPLNRPNHLTITQTDMDFNVLWKKTFRHQSKYLIPTYLLATSDRGCIVVGTAFQDNHYDLFALKINSDGTLGCNEIIVEDIRPYMFWPNPVSDQLNFEFSPDVTPKQVELYDLQGRLVCSQTNAGQSLNMEGLAAGQYVMKVTLEDGTTFTDKVVKE